MAKLTYNNTKNISTSYIPFELYCDYHLCVFYIKDFDPCFKKKTLDKLANKLKKLIILY